MVVLLTGHHGALVLLHVAVEHKTGQEAVQILLPNTVVPVVLEIHSINKVVILKFV